MSWDDFDSVQRSSPWDTSSTGGLSAKGSTNATTANPLGLPSANNGQQYSPNHLSRHGSDNDVGSMISSLTGNSNIFGKPNASLGVGMHSNIMNLDEAAVSDSGSDLFNPNLKDALSAISAPAVAAHANSSAGYSQTRLAASNLFGPASVAGVSVSQFGANARGGSNFLEKFASVTEKTRELERNLGKLSLSDTSRRPSMFNESGFSEPRKSFSDKLDTYMSSTGNNSPSGSRHLSFSSDHQSESSDDHGARGLWNPAAATAFYPQPQQAPQMYPFMVPGFTPLYDPQAQPQRMRRKDEYSEGSEEQAKANYYAPRVAAPPQISPYLAQPFAYGNQGAPPIATASTLPTGPTGAAPAAVPTGPSGSSAAAAAAAASAAVHSPGPPTSSPKLSKRGPRTPKSKKHIVRSPLLEEFRSNKSGRQYTLKDILGHGYEFSKDQHGSRFIQQQLATASDEDREVIFNEIRNYAIDLMTDVFGNYVIQKYFEHGNETQCHILFESMRGNFNFLSLQMYGCRVVQKCLESTPLDDQLVVIDELRPNILGLVKDQNGNHVIQKVIECIPPEQTPFILESLKKQIYHLSTHPYGCRVIQRLLEYSEEEDREYILGELKGYVYYLVQDQFGNYVIQHIIEHGSKEYQDLILQIVVENLVDLSKHKFASNAVEKCIVHQDSHNRDRVYDALLAGNTDRNAPLDETSALNLMMKDQFANYVVQKMVELVDTDRRNLLIFKIRQYLDMISNTTSSKHLASIDKLIAITQRYP